MGDMKRTPSDSPNSTRAPLLARAASVSALALALAVLALAIPAAAATSTQVWVTGGGDCAHERYQPKQIVIACADGTEILKNLKWERWNGREATGTGRDYVVSCNPDCAAGHLSAYPVTVTLTKPKSCKGRRNRVFSHALLKFGQRHPGSRSTEADSLGCPL
jgi:hypothetical protein